MFDITFAILLFYTCIVSIKYFGTCISVVEVTQYFLFLVLPAVTISKTYDTTAKQ